MDSCLHSHTCSQKHILQRTSYLLANKAKAFVWTITLVGFAQHWIKRFSSCSVVTGSIARHGKCSDVHLQTDQCTLGQLCTDICCPFHHTLYYDFIENILFLICPARKMTTGKFIYIIWRETNKKNVGRPRLVFNHQELTGSGKVCIFRPECDFAFHC